MVKDVSGKKGDSLYSSMIELVSRGPRKYKVCKDGVKTKKEFRGHSLTDHKVRNFVVSIKDKLSCNFAHTPTKGFP